MLNYDKVLTSVGEFGTYQKRLCLYVFIITIPNGLHLTTSVFNNITPDFRCAVPGLSNDSYTIQSRDHGRLVQKIVAAGEDGELYSDCFVYKLNNTASFNASQNLPRQDRIGRSNDSTSTIACDRWVYDEKDGVISQIVDFDLVCDRAMYKAHGNMMLLLGQLVGSLLGGALADLIGRKTAVVVASVVQSSCACLMAFSQSYHALMAFKFFLTATGSTAFLSVFILIAETVGVKRRSVASMAAMLGFTAGMFLLTLIQYLDRDWRTAQVSQSLPFLAYVVFWWLIDESPRWLLTKNRQKEVKSIIAHICRVNKVRVPQEVEMLTTDVAMMKSHDGKNGANDVSYVSGSGNVKIWHLCSSRKNAFRIVILCFSWVTISMVYFGLVLGVGDLIDGNIYINFSLQTLMEAISNVVCVFILERMGRKKIFCFTMIVSGLTILGIGALNLTQKETKWLSITLFCIGKFCITIGFSLVFIITAEVLPTKIRNSGLGFCSFVARFGGIISPYIVSASLLIPGPFGKAFPLLIFGVFSLISGLSAISLPETRNAKLPETFNEEDQSST